LTFGNGDAKAWIEKKVLEKNDELEDGERKVLLTKNEEKVEFEKLQRKFSLEVKNKVQRTIL
jgi:hypothetical protein